MKYLILLLLISTSVTSCKKEVAPIPVNITILDYKYSDKESATYWGFKFITDTSISINGWVKFDFYAGNPHAEYFGAFPIKLVKGDTFYYKSQIPVATNQTFKNIKPYTDIFESGYAINFKY